jgi:predicted small secreted protein
MNHNTLLIFVFAGILIIMMTALLIGSLISNNRFCDTISDMNKFMVEKNVDGYYCVVNGVPLSSDDMVKLIEQETINKIYNGEMK